MDEMVHIFFVYLLEIRLLILEAYQPVYNYRLAGTWEATATLKDNKTPSIKENGKPPLYILILDNAIHSTAVTFKSWSTFTIHSSNWKSMISSSPLYPSIRPTNK